MSTLRNKQRLLRLLSYLYRFTDEDHPVSTSQLVQIFQGEDANASRKTIQDDIKILIEEGHDIEIIKSSQHSYYMASREFEVPEVKLLIDAVSASKFITKEKSRVLVEKLMQFVSKPQAEQMVRHMYVADRIKAGNETIYYSVDTITEAINAGKKVHFQYFDYNERKERILRHNGEVYYHSPYALVWDSDRYYAIGFSDKYKDLVNFRVDRMYKVTIADEDSVPPAPNFDIEDYVQKQFKMYAGEDMDVVLECDNELMQKVIDHFGEEVNTWKSSDTTFRLRAVVSDSPTFYGWVFQYAGKIRIASPEKAIIAFRKMARMVIDAPNPGPI